MFKSSRNNSNTNSFSFFTKSEQK
uniref:Uncharacterized protein n=1 Tax=Arundo donax TaxID=35708 RepID=A0A0A8Y3U8_ARUDO